MPSKEGEKGSNLTGSRVGSRKKNEDGDFTTSVFPTGSPRGKRGGMGAGLT